VGFEKKIREQSKQNKSEQHAVKKERRQTILTRHERTSETNHELAI
jgi:hypothetical protein